MSTAVEQSEAKTADTIFTAEENEILVSNRNLRQKLVKLLTEDSNGKTIVPGGSAEKILLDQLLNGVDKEITTRAKLRIATKANENSSDMRQVLAKALLNHRTISQKSADPAERELPAHIRVEDIVPGEMDQGIHGFTLKDILREDE